jgi:NAD(P)-dependent dehydrogenase (short-subunit alcohol dehydrogenase family)
VCVDIRRLPLEDGFERDLDVSTDEAIATAGGQATFVEADVCDPNALDDAAETATTTFGRLDVWVNNAGTFQGLSSLLDETPVRFDRTIEINLKGTWHGCRAAVRKMLEQEPTGRVRGRLVNIGSIAGEIGQADIGAYSASKAAVHNLTRALAIELAPKLITVNAIAPGYFPTAMNRTFWDDPEALAAVRDLHPLPLGIPEDVAAAVAFLASRDADFVSGVVLPVDGGVLAK